MGQEGAAEQSAEERLKRDPFHETVKAAAVSVEAYIDFPAPTTIWSLQTLPVLYREYYIFRICLKRRCRCLPLREEGIYSAFSPGWSVISGKRNAPIASLPALICEGRNTGEIFIYGSGMCIGASFADEFFNCRIECHGIFPVAGDSAYIVYFVIGAVPPLVKRHSGADEDSVCISSNTVQHGSYVPVITDIVRAASVDGDLPQRASASPGMPPYS